MDAATQPTETQTSSEPSEPVRPTEDASESTGGAGAIRPEKYAGAYSSSRSETDTEQSGERDENGRYLSREAASYRRRLRETETERDSLRERLEGYERAEVERIAADSGLAAPGDVWTFGASLETLRGEDGIDAENVSGLVGEILKDRPGLKAKPVGDLGIGRGAGAAETRIETKPGLSALLKPERR